MPPDPLRLPNTAPVHTAVSAPDRDALFQLKAVYGWLSQHGLSVKPTLDKFDSRWGDFLPFERAHFVRAALHIYTSNADYSGLDFSVMARLVGYDDYPTEVELAHLDMVEHVKTPWNQLFDALVEAREACSHDRTLSASVGHWERRFFACNIGVTRRKLDRMSPAMRSYFFRRLAADVDQLNNLPKSTLPVDVLTPFQRFKIYLGFVENAYNLYRKAFSPFEGHPSDELAAARYTVSQLEAAESARRQPEARDSAAPFLLAAARQSVRDHQAPHSIYVVPVALALTQLTAPVQTPSGKQFHGLVRFQTLSLDEQRSAIAQVRDDVFEACQTYARGRRLDDAHDLPVATAHSLSHPEGRSRISSRYAERYYGTTAARWEAERGGGQLRSVALTPPNTAPVSFIDQPEPGLLFQLRAVYGWHCRFDDSLKPALHELEARWGNFLPSERADLIRIALHVSCTRTGPATLDYKAITRTVGFEDELTEDELAQREASELEASAWTQLMVRLTRLRIACPPARAAKASFGHWEHRFFACNVGVTRRKLYRMSSAMHTRMFERLAAAHNALASQPTAQTLPISFLPSADTVLAYAFNAEQKPSQRFALFLGLVEDLYALYRSVFLHEDVKEHPDIDLATAWFTVRDLEARGNDVVPFFLAVARQNAREHEARHADELAPFVRALGQLTKPIWANSATAFKGLVLFERLSPGEQVSAVNTARGLAFELCKDDAEGHALLNSQIVVARLSAAVRGTCFDAEGHISQAHLLDAHSLSHPAVHPRISPRYAQQYYRTTASRWEGEHGGVAA
ncbi:hypothetical protein JCM8208_005888 [Rhodotorula glutinis]